MSASSISLLPSFARAPSRVAIRRAASYEADLSAVLLETLREFNLEVEGKTILLKPNFVGLYPESLMTNTQPAVVGAARECFLRLGARRVVVGEGPALERDTEAVVESMRLRDYIGRLEGAFVDLNVDEVHRVSLKTRASSLKELYLPRTVLQADLVVSLPKLKTHHWAGVTLSLKNMFGIVPGCCYGWPKNILHWAGINQVLIDINSTVRPDFVIVDGIVGMEGNGPIHGTPKHCGVLVLGDDPVAVDATCTRLMDLAPTRIGYLIYAASLLGHLKEERIQQIGESIDSLRTPFEVIDAFRYLKSTNWHEDWNRNCCDPTTYAPKN